MREWPIDERPVPGNWWIPDDPGRRVPGVLERRPAGHGVLRLNDVLLEPPGNDVWRLRSEPIPLILGDTGGLRTVSLINCFEFNRSSPLSRATGPKSQTFGVQYSLITSIIGGEDDPSAGRNPDPPVHSVWTRLDVLDQWGNRGDFASEQADLEHHKDDSYSTAISLRWPGPLTSATHIGTISLTTPPTPPMATPHSYRLDVRRNCYLDCRLDPAIPLSELRERLLDPLRTFIALAIDGQPSFTQLTLTLDPHRQDITDLWFNSSVLDAEDNPRIHTEDEADRVVRHGFFTIRDIEANFGEVLARWFQLFDRLQTPIDSLLSAADYGSQRFTSDHFQSAAFAAEALHRSLGLSVDSVPPDQRKDIARRMVHALTPEERNVEWLLSRARGVAEPRYEDRLAQLMHNAPTALRQAVGADFPKRVKRARNYFAHLDDSRLPRPSADELHRLTSLLVLVMVSQLFNELGLDDIGSVVRKSDRFYELQRRGAVIATKLDDEEHFAAKPADDR